MNICNLMSHVLKCWQPLIGQSWCAGSFPLGEDVLLSAPDWMRMAWLAQFRYKRLVSSIRVQLEETCLGGCCWMYLTELCCLGS